jgi:hypothetical protein
LRRTHVQGDGLAWSMREDKFAMWQYGTQHFSNVPPSMPGIPQAMKEDQGGRVFHCEASNVREGAISAGRIARIENL